MPCAGAYNRPMAKGPPRWRQTSMEWLLVVAAIAIGVPAAAWLAQDRMIFFPQPAGSTAHLPARATPITVTAADGTRLHGLDRVGQRRAGADDHLLRRQRGGSLVHGCRSALAARMVDRRAQLSRLRRERGSAGRARARRRRARRSTTPSRHGTASTGIASCPSGAASGRRWPRTSPRSVPSRAPCWCRPSTASPPSAATTTPGFRCRCCCGIASTRTPMPSAAMPRCWRSWPARTRSFRSSARARSTTRGRGRSSWQVVPGADHNSLGATADFWDGIARFLARL